MMILSTLLLLIPQAGNLDDALKAAQKKAANGDFRGAIAALEAADASSSKNSAALTALGVFKLRHTEAAIASGQLTGLAVNDAFFEAAGFLEKASELPQAEPAAFENWSEALLNGGDRKNALRAADAGVKAFAEVGSVYAQRARIHVAMAQNATRESSVQSSFDAAIKDFEAATKLDQQNAWLCTKLGETIILAEFAKGEKAKPEKARKAAAKHWTTALKRDEKSVDLSAMCQWLGSEAVPLLEKVDKSKGKDATMAWYMGYAEYSSSPRNWEQVRLHFEKSLELNPGMSNSYFFLAQGAFDEGVRIQAEGDEARSKNAYRYAARSWAKYLASNGPNHTASVLATADGGGSAIAQLKWLAGVAIGNGDVDSAIGINAWITTTTPGDVEAWNNLGVMYRDAGQAEKSLPAYAQAAKLSPEDPQVLNDWAVIYHYYLKTEDKKAKDLYQQSIDLANSIMEQPGLSEEDRQRIRIALRDATNNLEKLKKGNRRNG
ncbi:MAG: hypothetical protein H8E15_17650 [Planctomycetes bacterium]|nr:hypothetical protein [Planctomycetota bacterium]